MPHPYHEKVEICGVETASLKTLTPEEKTELLRRAKKGDTNARDELIRGNLRLVLSIVQRFSGRGSMDDLFQVGCIGLIKAIDRFDLEAGVQLSTYAVPMIIGELRRYLRDDNSIRVSRSQRDLAYRALRKKEELTREFGREPSVGELAKALEETVENVSAALEAIADPISLYEPVYNEGGDSVALMDMISDPSSCDEAWLDNIALKEAVKKLNEREKKIIRMRFYQGKTQMEIASEIGISQAQVSRLEKGALDRIRKDF